MRHLASTGEVRNKKKILVRTPEVKRTLGRFSHKCGQTVKKQGVRM
jgi:hypothetical protein